MEYTVKYKGEEIKFYNLLTEGHNIDKLIMKGSVYERVDHKFEYLLKRLEPGSVIYDIGAYIGTFAIPFAIEGMKVHAFEGFPYNYERLKKNCEVYDNIEVNLIAVSNKNATVETKFNDCTNREPESCEINYTIFDEYIEENGIEMPDLVKIDIEGMETLALFGMTNLLENVRPIWQIGYHAGMEIEFDDYPGFVKTKDGGFDFDTFIKLDYDVYDESGKLVNKFTTWGEYLCVPK